MKKVFVILGWMLLSFLFPICFCIAQEESNKDNSSQINLADSLDKDLSYLVSEIKRYENIDRDSSIILCRKLLSIAIDREDYYFQSKAYQLLVDYQGGNKIYADSAFLLAKKTGDADLQASALNKLGSVFNVLGNNTEALKYYLEVPNTTQNIDIIFRSKLNIINVHLDREDYEQASIILNEIEAVVDKVEEANQSAFFSIVGYIYLNEDKLELSKQAYEKMNHLAVLADDYSSQINAMQNIGIIEELSGNFDAAEKIYFETLALAKKVKNKRSELYAYTDLGILYGEKKKQYGKAIKYANKQYELAKEISDYRYQKGATEVLYAAYEAKGDYKNSLNQYKLFKILSDSLLNIENTRKVTELSVANKFRDQQMRDSIAILTSEQGLVREKSRRKNTSILLGLSLLAGLLMLSLYFQTRKARKRSDELLLNILPENTAAELKKNGYASPRKYQHVSILFADIKNFTSISAILNPDELVSMIDDCFKAFDDISKKYELEKIKTIGDAYLVVSGIPKHSTQSASNIILAATDMLHFVKNYKNTSLQKYNLPPIELRIGIHTGEVIAGVVGKSKFQFDIWGNAVNIAARLESKSLPGKINVSNSTFDAIHDKSIYNFDPRGKIQIKNRGEIEMYFVERNLT